MDSNRRIIILGLPLASASLLTGCGGGGDTTPSTAASGTPAVQSGQLMKAAGLPVSGGITVSNAAFSANFPGGGAVNSLSVANAIACINGSVLSLCLGDTDSATSYLRGLQLQMSLASGATLSVSSLAGGATTFTDGEITGLLVATAPLTSTTRPLINLAYVPALGSVQVKAVDTVNKMMTLVLSNLLMTGAKSNGQVTFPDFADQSSTGWVKLAASGSQIVVPYVEEVTSFV